MKRDNKGRFVKEEEFKVGDRVIVNGKHGGKVFHNHKGRLVGINKDTLSPYGIEFDDYIGGHSCDGLGKCGYCWYVRKNMLIIDEEEEKLKFDKHKINLMISDIEDKLKELKDFIKYAN